MFVVKRHDYTSPAKWTIRSFEDALQKNIRFLRGEYASSPYHGGAVYDMDVRNLVYLNAHGFLTFDGQSNECEYNTYFPPTRNKYYNNGVLQRELDVNAQYVSTEQKSYLTGFIENYVLNDLLDYLESLNGAVRFYFYEFDSDQSFSNLPRRRNWVTRECGSSKPLKTFPWEESTWITDDPQSFYDVFDIKPRNFPNLVYFAIYIDVQCQANVEDVLVGFIKQEKPNGIVVLRV